MPVTVNGKMYLDGYFVIYIPAYQHGIFSLNSFIVLLDFHNSKFKVEYTDSKACLVSYDFNARVSSYNCS